jgi:O-antigen/teichoic acid export membrane protein
MMNARMNMMGTGAVVANQGFNSLTNLAITLWLIRILGISAFGTYAVYWLVCLVTVSVVVALITLPMVSLAGHLEGRRRTQLISAAAVLTVAAALAILGLAAGGQLAGADWGGALLPVGAITAAQLLAEFARRTLFFLRRPLVVWSFDLLRFGLLASGYYWLASRVASPGPIDFVLAMAAANSAAMTVFCIALYPQGARQLDLTEFRRNARRLFANGRWLALSNVVQFFNDNFFLLVASIAINPTATGVLRTCQAVAGLVNPLILTLEHVLPRRLGEDIRRRGEVAAIRAYVESGRLVLFGFGLILGALALFAEPVLSLASADQAAGYGWLLQLFCVLNVLVTLVALVNILLRAFERTLPIFISPLIAAGLSLLAALPLASSFGVAGVAAGMIAAQLVITVLQVSAARSALHAAGAASIAPAPRPAGGSS